MFIAHEPIIALLKPDADSSNNSGTEESKDRVDSDNEKDEEF